MSRAAKILEQERRRYDQDPCPRCGKLISRSGLARARHMRSHRQKRVAETPQEFGHRFALQVGYQKVGDNLYQHPQRGDRIRVNAEGGFENVV